MLQIAYKSLQVLCNATGIFAVGPILLANAAQLIRHFQGAGS